MVAPDFVVSEIHKRSIGKDGAPLGETPMQESKLMTAEECASMILKGMSARKRLVMGSLRGKVGRFVRLFAPSVIDGVARRAIARGR
jgi:short-subunit dehydrogenase